MRRRQGNLGGLAAGGLLLLLAAVPSAAAAADPFYEGLLRDGTRAYFQHDPARAAKLLRLACFGLLEEPPVLAGCLTHLALAEAALGDKEGFVATFRRISEVERRFEGYSQAEEISPVARQAFEEALERWVAAEELLTLPAFHDVARKIASENGDEPAGEEHSEPAAPITAPSSLPPELVAELAVARQLVRSTASAAELEAAFVRIRQIADQHPEDAGSQFLAAEFAYRLTRWPECAHYFRRGGAIADDQPLLLFYFAVALYETGDPEAAARVLERCLPRLRRTRVVREYSEKILAAAE